MDEARLVSLHSSFELLSRARPHGVHVTLHKRTLTLTLTNTHWGRGGGGN